MVRIMLLGPDWGLSCILRGCALQSSGGGGRGRGIPGLCGKRTWGCFLQLLMLTVPFPVPPPFLMLPREAGCGPVPATEGHCHMAPLLPREVAETLGPDDSPRTPDRISCGLLGGAPSGMARLRVAAQLRGDTAGGRWLPWAWKPRGYKR